MANSMPEALGYVATAIDFYVPPRYTDRVVFEACGRDNLLRSWGDYTYNAPHDGLDDIRMMNYLVDLDRNAYDCCVACLTTFGCSNAQLDYDGSTACRLRILDTCPDPKATIGRVPRAVDDPGGYMTNGGCGGLLLEQEGRRRRRSIGRS